jgi:hypothetical protein
LLSKYKSFGVTCKEQKDEIKTFSDFFKTKMKIFDPNLLTDKQKESILAKFETLSKRQIQDYENEYKQKDRIAFDEEILKAYGFKTDILPQMYSLLTETIRNRVEMKNR